MIPELIKVECHNDSRGQLTPVELEEPALRFYTSFNWMCGMVRAWHGHPKEWRVVRCIRGAAKVCVIDMSDMKTVYEFVLSGDKGEVLHIPKGYANGWKSLRLDTELLYLAPTHFSDRDDVRIDSDIRKDVWDSVKTY